VIVAAVPVKDLDAAKQRLVRALAPERRRALARAMLLDVLDAVEAALPGALVLITRDPDVLALARERRLPCLVETANRGHTAAVAEAQAHARDRGAERFLTLPGDVPCVTPQELSAVCRAGAGPPAAVFVPSASGLGTNAVLLSPPDVMPLTFGEPSFDSHLAAARARGLAPVVLPLPGLGLDVDAPEDLARLLERGAGTRSGRLLAGWPEVAEGAGRA
jgi:2-phospho-L-lactate guanylyltransferase